MKIEICSETKYKELFLDGNFSFLQSWEWGETKRPTWEPLRINMNTMPITVLTRRLPFSNKLIGYIPRAFDNSTTDIFNTLTELINFLKTNYSLSHIDLDTEITDLEKLDLILKIGFKNTKEQVQPNNTNVIDLSHSPDEILQGLKSQVRNKIRKPAKEGCKIEIFENGEEGIERFWGVMKSVIQNTDYVAHEKSYFENVWKTMSASSMANIIIASKNGEDFGTYFSTRTNTWMYELYGGINKLGRSIRGAGYFLKWNSVLYAKGLNLERYDQWGVAPKRGDDYDKKHQLYYISKFKKEFSGNDIEFLPKLTYILDRKAYQIFLSGRKFNDVKIWLKKRT